MLKKLTKAAGEVLEFPADIAGKGPKITVLGRHEIIVEYYREVIEFSEQKIELDTTDGKLSIRGSGFVLTAVLPTEIHIKGIFHHLSLEEREE
ncbi:sporulation protein YqfC [Syntrophobotulus glycolicus DSM 8271]|uniref:Sporulation protein YqfC n=1 Tax=Syntrophobotulus glycolicus (strain DSM 8271 / FlGlyR) TaxID=645991 RepID=F0SVE0_SYNGF|nr:YabP/YqfC family sporulation protein [Syntrophobotulus glycolicus]ADY56713.1 sporulation protein YqfC [Syntrophobotulus glycolicus DSM 8271]